MSRIGNMDGANENREIFKNSDSFVLIVLSDNEHNTCTFADIRSWSGIFIQENTAQNRTKTAVCIRETVKKLDSEKICRRVSRDT